MYQRRTKTGVELNGRKWNDVNNPIDPTIADEGNNLANVLKHELSINDEKALAITKAIAWLVDLGIREYDNSQKIKNAVNLKKGYN